MTDREWTVLAPVRILRGESLPRGIVDFLTPVNVVVLGYHVVPDQTPPGQARLQFEEQAEAALADVAAEIESQGGTVETRLVFTDDREQTVDRVARETGAEVILHPNPVASVDRLLVALRGEVNAERIADFVASVVAGRAAEVTLFGSTASEETAEERGALLATAAERMREAGVDADAITERVEVTDAPLEALVAAATDHDAAVMGETEPTLETFVFGDRSRRVAERSLNPVLVVTGVGPDAAAAGTEADADPADGGSPTPGGDTDADAADRG